MTMNLSARVADSLPLSVKQTLAQMPDTTQSVFEEEYKHKMKSPATMQLLAIFFPIHHFLLGKIGIGMLFWLTAGGFFIWWFIEIFTVRGQTRNYNEDIARKLVLDMKVMGH